MAQKMFGYYSGQAEQDLGLFTLSPTYVQIGPNGERVMAWFSSKEDAEEYRWPDKVFVGEFDPATFRSQKINPEAVEGADPRAAIHEMRTILKQLIKRDEDAARGLVN